TGFTSQVAYGLIATGGNTLDTGAYQGLAVTINIFDGRNQKTKTEQTLRQLDETTTRTTLDPLTFYNAFGEVKKETDAAGHFTLYYYNTLGKLVTREDPGTFSMDEHGVVGTAVRQQTHYGYDLSGRMISTTDAYGHSVTRDILANTGY